MDAEELTCKELVELVTDYLEGTLPQAERVRFEEHLATCDACHIYLQQMRQTLKILGRLSEELLPEAAKHDLLQLFRDWKRG